MGNLNSRTASVSHSCIVNRLKYVSPLLGHTDYKYRADGMRVEKNHASGVDHEEGEPDPGLDYISDYYYDGQMPMETYEERSNGAWQLTRNGLGARGIDVQTLTTNTQSEAVAFPIYDGHGNQVAVISRNGSGGFNCTNRRSYDAWGVVRKGATTGEPNGRYCANLGHVQDDESGLIYVRARYYEPWTGRFVSEDPATNGKNWFIYCRNNPIGRVDQSGTDDAYIELNKWLGPLIAISTMLTAAYLDPVVRMKTAADIGFLLIWFALDMREGVQGSGDMRVLGAILINAMTDLIVMCLAWDKYAAQIASSSSPGMKAVLFALEHASFLSLFMSLEQIAEGG